MAEVEINANEICQLFSGPLKSHTAAGEMESSAARKGRVAFCFLRPASRFKVISVRQLFNIR